MKKKHKKLKNIINILSQKLKNDKGYYIGWKSNIAMAFIDVYKENSKKNIHKIANEAADRFLQSLLIK